MMADALTAHSAAARPPIETDHDEGRQLRVLERTFSILDLFTRQHPEWSTTEIARACGLPIPTAHRILSALRRRGFVTQDARSKRFRLGIGALDLGERARSLVDVRAAALPILRRLCHDSGETALLTMLSEGHDRSVCLERVESPHPLRLSVEPGRQMPLHAGASQKALLAYLPQDEIDRVASGPLERLCRATITNPRDLLADVARIRRRGWASSFEETNIGVWGLAVTLLDAHGSVIGALGLAGPSARMSRTRTREDLARLRTATDDLAKVLGAQEEHEPLSEGTRSRHGNRSHS
jgi:IclR family transcriptional regulator, acetate operon repressor